MRDYRKNIRDWMRAVDTLGDWQPLAYCGWNTTALMLKHWSEPRFPRHYWISEIKGAVWLSGLGVEYEKIPLCYTNTQFNIHFYIHYSLSTNKLILPVCQSASFICLLLQMKKENKKCFDRQQPGKCINSQKMCTCFWIKATVWKWQ